MPHGGEKLAGAGAPQQAPPQQVQVATDSAQGGDQQLIMQVLEQAITQSVNQEGFVDVKQLAQIWPQVAQQAGLNIPFQTVLQMIQQDPGIIEEMIQRLGLAGITIEGRNISGEELAQQGTGATGAPQPQTQGQGPQV